MPLPLSALRHFHFSHRIHKNFLELDNTLKALCFTGRLLEAVEILCRKESPADPQTYAFLLQECINLKELKLGRRIHAHMIIAGFVVDEYLRTKLVIFYAKNGELDTARLIFDKIPQRSLVLWNALISGYVQKGLEEDGLNLYHEMRRVGLKPDQFTFATVFRACARLAMLEQGKRAHGTMIKSRIEGNVIVNSALVDMYFKCSNPTDGRHVFDKSSERNVVMWTALISGYGHHGQVEEVLGLFKQMIDGGFMPNYVTFLAVLSACSHGGLISEGRKYFLSMTRDYNIRPKREHYAALVDLLGRAGYLDEAYQLVQRSPCEQHSVIWGALLGACRIHGDAELVMIAAKRFFELEKENMGKYIVLSNAFASSGQWENVTGVRQLLRQSGMSKEPGCSWIEVQTEVHTFFVGDNAHEQRDCIYKTIKELDCILNDVGYVPDIKSP